MILSNYRITNYIITYKCVYLSIYLHFAHIGHDTFNCVTTNLARK